SQVSPRALGPTPVRRPWILPRRQMMTTVTTPVDALPDDRSAGITIGWASGPHAAALICLVVVGAAHMSEHVVQVVQLYVLHLSVGRGVLGAVADIEPVHFTYNVAYLLFLILALPRVLPRAALQRRAALLIAAALVLQCWHML